MAKNFQQQTMDENELIKIRREKLQGVVYAMKKIKLDKMAPKGFFACYAIQFTIFNRILSCYEKD